jgi:hypothetical protein
MGIDERLILKWNLKSVRVGMDSSETGKTPMANFREDDNEPSGSIEVKMSSDQLSESFFPPKIICVMMFTMNV